MILYNAYRKYYAMKTWVLRVLHLEKYLNYKQYIRLYVMKSQLETI